MTTLAQSNFLTSLGWSVVEDAGNVVFGFPHAGQNCVQIQRTGAVGWTGCGIVWTDPIPAALGQVVYFSAFAPTKNQQNYQLLGVNNSPALGTDIVGFQFANDRLGLWQGGGRHGEITDYLEGALYNFRLTIGTSVLGEYKLASSPDWITMGSGPSNFIGQNLHAAFCVYGTTEPAWVTDFEFTSDGVRQGQPPLPCQFLAKWSGPCSHMDAVKRFISHLPGWTVLE